MQRKTFGTVKFVIQRWRLLKVICKVQFWSVPCICSCYNYQRYKLRLHSAGKAAGVLYEDDGDGYEFTRGEYLLTYYVAELQSSVVTVKVSNTEGSWRRPKRRIHVNLLLGGGAKVCHCWKVEEKCTGYFLLNWIMMQALGLGLAWKYWSTCPNTLSHDSAKTINKDAPEREQIHSKYN